MGALEIEADAERQAFIEARCGDNEPLRQEINRLLAHQGEVGSFLESPPPGIDGGVSPTADYRPLEQTGQMIGPYKLRERLGAGGMGVVWAAERKKPIRQKVAVKVIKPGMDSEQVIARFEAEREALAMMDHPNIARVLDAGTTEQGRPYFVMELIHGVPITEYCDTHGLTVPERLKLFIQVCKAVQHAHSKLIVHRDIKPSNVLVTEHDGTPVPKVIDFGVAKALHQPLTDRSIYTSMFQAIGTLAYMSPEQATLSGKGVDTCADVYGLGVLLYELLTGTTPFDRQQLEQAAFDEALRIIREEDAPNPSKRISTLGDNVTVTHGQRKGAEELGRIVSGDLDCIVMKALEKDRDRRYGTADAFADDIERHLSNEPVEARPQSAGYRLSRFYRRNRALVVGMCLCAVFLMVIAGMSLRFGVQAQRQRAETQWQLYLADMRLAVQAWEAGQLLKLERLLEKHKSNDDGPDFRGMEWSLLRHLHSDAISAPERDHGGHVRRIAVSPDELLLASVDHFGRVKIWDLKTRRLQKVYGEDHNEWSFRRYVAFSPDGKVLARPHSSDDAVALTDVATGTTIAHLQHDSPVYDADFSADGKWLATTTKDGKLSLWDWRNKKVETLTIGSTKARIVAFSPTANLLACGILEGSILMIDCESRQTYPLKGHQLNVTNLAFSPDGSLLASGCSDGKVNVWILATRTRFTLPNHIDEVRSLAFTPDGAQLVTCGRERSVRVWDVGTRNQAFAVHGHLQAVNGLAFSDAGRVLITGSDDGKLKFWDLARVEKDRSLIPRNVVAIREHRLPIVMSPNGRVLAIGGRDESDRQVTLWDLDSTTRVPPFIKTSEAIRWLAMPRDVSVITLSGARTIQCWNLMRRELVGEFLVTETSARIAVVSISSNRQKLIAGHDDGSVTTWDVESREMEDHATMYNVPVAAASISDNGSICAACSVNGQLKIWASGDEHEILADRQFDRGIIYLGLQFSRGLNPKWLAVRGFGKRLRIWDWRNEDEPVSAFKSFTTNVSGLAFTPDDSTLIITSTDRTMQFYDLNRQVERVTLSAHRHAIESPFPLVARSISLNFLGRVGECVGSWFLSSSFALLESHKWSATT